MSREEVEQLRRASQEHIRRGIEESRKLKEAVEKASKNGSERSK